LISLLRGINVNSEKGSTIFINEKSLRAAIVSSDGSKQTQSRQHVTVQLTSNISMASSSA
jgi:hypothetical protein